MRSVVLVALVAFLRLHSASFAVAAEPASPNSLATWEQKDNVKVSLVSDNERHSLHTYFNTSPESPDGKWVLFFASTAAHGHAGEIRIRERQSGEEIVLATDIATEDAHRAACQQWACGGKQVVFHNVLPDGQWAVMAVDVPTSDGKVGKPRVVTLGRQLGFGQPGHAVFPIYGPHWNPGDHRDLELVNIESGDVIKTGMTATGVREQFPEFIEKKFGDKPISIFFPILSPDRNRVFCKIASPAGGDFRSKAASFRFGQVAYDLKEQKFLSLTEQWGHPSWHPNSRDILDCGRVIDCTTGKWQKIPDYAKYRGDHPTYNPAATLFTTDTISEGFGGPAGYWDVVVGDVITGKTALVHRFDHSKGARSWRVSHPHPAFSADGKRLYFNVSDGPWTRVHVAEVK
ncbi:hypothetical protein ETAA8_58890 [Anatilimnocola aggregata]|uniref:Uncharacterized protein n=1 Tax=Anatilimnocola aggregata TaxID=2528021 RepID=A0A517YKI2_9BACT|nr:PD40 domain-containing protein [Anatilimnocola aggregata]QDU30741.1 hypothetical protein ETAA8_58890 [Anatilimnocola aggregata]